MAISFNGITIGNTQEPIDPSNISGITLDGNKITVTTVPQQPTVTTGNIIIGNTGASTPVSSPITVGNNIVINNPTGNPVFVKPKPTTDSVSSTPATVTKPAEEPKLRPINQTKFATPNPRVATSKEDLAKIKGEIEKLEKQTNLNLLPYLFGGELARIKHQFTGLNVNKYYLLLCLLVYGFDNNIMSASIGENNPKYIIDDNFIKDFQRMIKIPQLSDILKKTPAFAKGCFEEVGQMGNMAAGGDMMDNNPITGPNRYTPSLVTNTMEKIWPGSVNKLEKFCNMIRTRAYLTMPKSAFGSIQKVVRIINGVVKAFNKMMNNFYKLMIKYIKQVYAWINGIIADIQKQLMKMIEDIIPLDLICLLLDTMQCILDDLNFFTSLFNMTGPMLNVLNTIQTYVNTASNFVKNPFNTLASFLPPEIKNIIDKVDQIGSDPEGFISDTLSNFGLSYINTALQGDVVGALAEKFGSNYASKASPLADVMSKASAIWNRYSADGSTLPTGVNDFLDKNLFDSDQGVEDKYGNPKNFGDIIRNTQEDFKNISSDVSTLGGTVKSDISKITGSVGSGINNLGTTIKNVFNSNKKPQDSDGVEKT